MSRLNFDIGSHAENPTPTVTPRHRWRGRTVLLIGALIIAAVGLAAIFWPQPGITSATPAGKGYECLLSGGNRAFWTWSTRGDTVMGNVDFDQFGGPVTGTQSGSSLLLYESQFPIGGLRVSYTATVEGDVLKMRFQGAHNTFDCKLETDTSWNAYVKTLATPQQLNQKPALVHSSPAPPPS